MMQLNYKKSVTELDVRHSAIYKQALYIYELSRKLNENQRIHASSKEKSLSYILEDLILISIRLPFTIALAQTTSNYSAKLRSSNYISQCLKRIQSHCKKLKNQKVYNCKDLARMNNEIRLFTNTYRKWSLILTQQN